MKNFTNFMATLLCVWGLGGSLPEPVEAATLTVVTTNDSVPGSLRRAVQEAAAGDTIVFAPNVTGTITLTNGLIEIGRSLNIVGRGANIVTVSGNNTQQIFLFRLFQPWDTHFLQAIRADYCQWEVH
jgi:hypothetical protein